MNTEYLKEFVVLAETKNFWEASERLYMNQSTLSKHIKTLEKDLGVDLFARTTRHVTLTNYGQAFLPYARSISRTEYEGITAIRHMQNIENGLLTIGTMPSMPQYRITEFLAAFQSEYPDTTVRLTEDDPVSLMEYLKNETCELIFTREDKETFEKNFMKDTEIVRIPYIKDSLVVLMQKDHPLAEKDTVSLQELSGEHFCFIKEGSLMYQICMDACQEAGVIPDIIFTSHRIDSIIDMVTNQDCVALLMDQHVDMPKNGPKQLDVPWTVIPVTPAVETQVSLCYKTEKPLSKAAQLFVDYCSNSLFKEND